MQIPGPAGALEAAIDEAVNSAGKYAILCHPHPQYGGNMHDAVLDCLARALGDSGISCLKFNFRGVGRSEGAHRGAQEGVQGEVDDLYAIADWLYQEHSPSSLVLGGYSFGANIVWKGLARGLDAERVLLVAPPIGAMQFSEFAAACPVDVFAGDADQFIDTAALTAWRGIQLHRLSGADHFFSGQQHLLQARISDTLR